MYMNKDKTNINNQETDRTKEVLTGMNSGERIPPSALRRGVSMMTQQGTDCKSAPAGEHKPLQGFGLKKPLLTSPKGEEQEKEKNKQK